MNSSLEIAVIGAYVVLIALNYWGLQKAIHRLLDPNGEMRGIPLPLIIRMAVFFAAVLLPGAFFYILFALTGSI